MTEIHCLLHPKPLLWTPHTTLTLRQFSLKSLGHDGGTGRKAYLKDSIQSTQTSLSFTSSKVLLENHLPKARVETLNTLGTHKLSPTSNERVHLVHTYTQKVAVCSNSHQQKGLGGQLSLTALSSFPEVSSQKDWKENKRKRFSKGTAGRKQRKSRPGDGVLIYSKSEWSTHKKNHRTDLQIKQKFL